MRAAQGENLSNQFGPSQPKQCNETAPKKTPPLTLNHADADETQRNS